MKPINYDAINDATVAAGSINIIDPAPDETKRCFLCSAAESARYCTTVYMICLFIYGRFLERQLILTAGQVGHVTGGYRKMRFWKHS